jgi:hypothetical protein
MNLVEFSFYVVKMNHTDNKENKTEVDIKTLKERKTKMKTKYLENKDKSRTIIKQRTIEIDKIEYSVGFVFNEIKMESSEDVYLEIVIFDKNTNYVLIIKSWYCFDYISKKYTDVSCIVKATERFKKMNKTFLEKLVNEKLNWESVHGIEMIKKFNTNILVKNISESDITMSLRKSGRTIYTT